MELRARYCDNISSWYYVPMKKTILIALAFLLVVGCEGTVVAPSEQKPVTTPTASTTQISQLTPAQPPRLGGKPEDKYSCAINSDGYCIFSGIPHKTGLKPNTEDIVDAGGIFLFTVNEGVAVNSSGEILQARGTPASNGDELVRYSKGEMAEDEKAFHRVMATMFPIRNALMYEISEISQSRWEELVSELKMRGIKNKTFTNGATPKDNFYGRNGIFELAKNPEGKDIHHDVMKFLEEAGLYFLCHVTSDDFAEMLQDSHPEGHDPCEDAKIAEKIPF